MRGYRCDTKKPLQNPMNSLNFAAPSPSNLLMKLKFPALYLFGIFLLVHKTIRFHQPFNIGMALLFLLLYCLAIYGITRLLTAISRQHLFVVTVLGFLVSFFFADLFLHGLHNNLSLTGFRNRHYLLLILLLSALMLYGERALFTARPRLYLQLNKVLCSFLLILTAVSLCSGIWEKYRLNRRATGDSNITRHPTEVVWLLMDGYGSSAALEQYFGYHNELDIFLQRRHFVMLDAVRSRFGETLFSLHAIFNNDDSLLPPDYGSSLARLEKRSWVAGLRQAGVPFHNLDFIPIGGQPRYRDLYFFPDTYLKQLLYGSLLFNAVAEKTSGSIDDYNHAVITRLNSLLQQAPGAGGVTWAHLLIPHQPFFRDRDGRLVREEKPLKAGPALKRQYIAYLQYGNKVIENLFRKDSLLQNRIVIISGDHGARFPFIPRADWRRPFCAIHFPNNFDTAGLKQLRYISQIPAFVSK
jgi:hypothetical protein